MWAGSFYFVFSVTSNCVPEVWLHVCTGMIYVSTAVESILKRESLSDPWFFFSNESIEKAAAVDLPL